MVGSTAAKLRSHSWTNLAVMPWVYTGGRTYYNEGPWSLFCSCFVFEWDLANIWQLCNSSSHMGGLGQHTFGPAGDNGEHRFTAPTPSPPSKPTPSCITPDPWPTSCLLEKDQGRLLVPVQPWSHKTFPQDVKGLSSSRMPLLLNHYRCVVEECPP